MTSLRRAVSSARAMCVFRSGPGAYRLHMGDSRGRAG